MSVEYFVNLRGISDIFGDKFVIYSRKNSELQM